MDANGLNFRMLSRAPDWLPSGVSNGNLYYCTASGYLQLRSLRNGPAPTKDFATAQARIETSPMARDQFGNYARWDAAGKTVLAGGAVSGRGAEDIDHVERARILQRGHGRTAE